MEAPPVALSNAHETATTTSNSEAAAVAAASAMGVTDTAAQNNDISKHTSTDPVLLSVERVMEAKPPYDVSAVSPERVDPAAGTTSPAPVTPVRVDVAGVGASTNTTSTQPETTVSLDKEEDVSDLDKSPPTDPERSIATEEQSARADPCDNDDDDSSNDDSSYFADPVHLPEPKSGRRYSWSSNASGNGTTNNSSNSTSAAAAAMQQQIAQAMSRESDASLSLSDDSDEGGGHPVHHHYPPFTQQQHQPQHRPYQPQPYPQQQPQMLFQPNPPIFMAQQPGGVPELYAEQIMPRMHSVSSLVSTSSQNSSQSDTSIRDELSHVAIQQSQSEQQRQQSSGPMGSTVPSGRRSPILGEHPPSRNGSQSAGLHLTTPFSPSTAHNPSPPTILQHYPYPPAQPHPFHQPQPTTAGEQTPQHPQHPFPAPPLASSSLSAWRDGGGASGGGTRSHTLPFVERRGGSNHPSQPSLASPYSKESELAYSGDSDSQHQLHRSYGSGMATRTGGSDDVGGTRAIDSRRSREPPVRDALSSHPQNDTGGFKVYWQRWLMLMYMSALNLLSDWTCYSVAPIALLTMEAFGSVNAESLVVVFLCANGVSTACEPIILSRLGLKKTVLLGSLLLMIGSIVKSGGLPPIIQAEMKKGEGEWRVYLGFFLVGLSQPLYQCTPALLSASWFPEKERTMATGVALNANQLGIGFAFVFGTLLVKTSDDIPKYFSLLSLISTFAFIGVLFQFDDAPPTPPSDTARVMRGDIEVNLPTVRSIFDSVRNIAVPTLDSGQRQKDRDPNNSRSSQKPSSKGLQQTNSSTPSKESRSREAASDESQTRRHPSNQRRTRKSKSANQKASTSTKSSSRRAAGSSSSTRRRNVNKSAASNAGFASTGFHGLAPAPSPARGGPVGTGLDLSIFPAPSPALPGQVGKTIENRNEAPVQDERLPHQPPPYAPYGMAGYPPHPGFPGMHFPVNDQNGPYSPGHMGYPPSQQVPIPYWDPQAQQQAFFQQQQAQLAYQQGYHMPTMDPYYSYYSYQHGVPYPQHPPLQYNNSLQHVLPSAGPIDEGAEPVLTLKAHQLDIDIRDDQIWLSIRACFSRRGFIHSLVSFTVSGIVINTLSTFMDYLVRLNGAGREYTGIVGGTFQFVIMISSLLIGRVCDKTRAYYSITIAMLVFGAFGLAECGVSLEADRGTSLRYALILVALLVGPLQPVSTELGVDVVYPLSENTVLVVQQLFSNLLSAAFIPCFKAMKDFGSISLDNGETERPAYTFSFYVLIVLHAAATVFFATFNGRYLRFEHEKEKLAIEEGKRHAEASRAFHPIASDRLGEYAPLMNYDV